MAAERHQPDWRIAEINATIPDEAERLRAIMLSALEELQGICPVSRCSCSAGAVSARIARARLQEGLGVPVSDVWEDDEVRRG